MRLPLLGLLLFQFLFVQAQQETLWFGFPIVTAEKKSINSYLLTIEYGADAGLKKGMQAEVYATLQQERKKEARYLAKLNLMEVLSRKASAIVETNEAVYPGDLVFVQIPYKKTFKSSYFYLASYGIIFTDPSGKPYYSVDEILKSDGYRLRSEKFVAMQKAVNLAGEELKISNAQDRVREGPDKGKLLYEVLQKADTLAVWRYLYHETMRYAQNMGQSLPFVKNFIDYTREGDRATPAELKELLMNASLEQLEQHVQHYRRRLTKGLVSEWYNSAKEDRLNKHYARAHSLLDVCIFISGKLNDAYNEARYNYEKALVYEAENELAAASLAYDKAAERFAAANSDFGIGFARHYGAELHQRAGNPEAAQRLYSLAREARLNEFNSDRSDADAFRYLFNTLTSMAKLARDQRQFEKAIDLYKEALQYATITGNVGSQAEAYWSLAFTYDNGLNNKQAGFENYERALQLHTQLNDTASMVSLKRNQAILFEELKAYDKAKEKIGEAIRYGRAWNKPATLAHALDYDGSLHYLLKDYTRAIASYSEAEKIYRQLNDTSKWVAAIRNVSKSYRDSRNIKVAIAKTRELFPLVQKNKTSQADAWWDLAYLHSSDQAGEPRKAIEYYQHAAQLYQQLKDTTNLTTVLANSSGQFKALKDSTSCFKMYRQAVALNQSMAHRGARAGLYEKMASAYEHFTNYRKAYEYNLRAFKEYQLLQDADKSGVAARNTGKSLAGLKDFAQAGAYYLQAVEIFRKSGNKNGEAEAHWDYGYNQGTELLRFDEGISRYKIAFDLFMQVGDSVNASTMLSNIGQVNWSKRNFNTAIESHQAAIALAQKCRNQSQVASSWSKLASLFTETNNPVAASEALGATVAALKVLNDSTQLPVVYQDLAASYTKTQDYARALEYYQEAILILKKQRDSTNWALALSGIGGVYLEKADYKNAEKYYQETQRLQQRIRDKVNLVYTLANLGLVAQVGYTDYKKAATFFNEAVKLSTEIKDNNIVAYSYLRLKGLHKAQGRYTTADEYISKALDIYLKSNRVKDAAFVLAEMSNDASYVHGDNIRALQLLDRAQAAADTLNDISLKAYLLEVRSTITAEAGEFDRALALAQQSLALYKSVASEWGMAGAYIDLGNIYKQVSEYDNALKCQLASDSLYRKVNSAYNRLAPLANIGTVYTAQGDYGKGLEYYRKSYEIMKQVGDYNENFGIIHSLLGEAYFYQSDFVQSDKWLRESLTIFDKVGATRPRTEALSILARLKIEEQKFEEAAKFLEEGLRVAKEKNLRVNYLEHSNLLGQLEVRQKKYTAAKPWLEETVKLSREIGKYNTLWESLYWLGILYKENKQLAQSSAYLKEAVDVIDKIRNKVSGGEEARKLFSSDKNILKVYEALVDVLLQLGEPEIAMSYLQKSNEENLRAKFKGLDVKFESQEKTTIVAQERTMKARLDGIEEQIAKEKALPAVEQNQEKLKRLEGTKTIAEGDYLKFVNQQVNVRPELTRYFNNSVQPVEFRREKKNIPEDMALISYLPGETQLYIFVATRDTVIAKIVNVSREKLTRNVNAMLNVTRTQMGAFPQLDLSREDQQRNELVFAVKQQEKVMLPFEEMYQYLIAPAAAEIVSKKRLGIIATGVLNYIPFQLLGKTLANGEFSLLVNQYALFYVSSTNILRLGNPDKNFKIIAFGNPDKTLPSTEREVAEIKKIYPTSTIFLREQATEDKVKAAGENFNIMHFATHGNLDYEDFTQSFLTMAGGKDLNGDGKLTLEELWGMEVMNNLSIVVLSACQTAVTKGSSENSPVSPASGFLQNGVKSVVATLWKVDDEATAILMTEFYKNLRTMATVDALRQAQVSLSRTAKYRHPYFWAGAILLGDWR
ncbi:MAG: CHAT domain-containing protein [Cyclobacteriaceae bacterium]|nr:CHAT domain-containing protein [Cyclobacteriaceae bacterium]